MLNGMLADVFRCQEIIVPHAPKKLVDGRLQDEAVVGFAVQQPERFLRVSSRATEPAGS